jgi:D-amino-acid dehydrogenase
VLPLAEPGAVWQGLRAILSRNAPFRIAPRFEPALWSWLWRFARRCNLGDMLQAGRALQPLLESSLALYHELMATERLACEWQTQGLLFVCRTPKGMEGYAATDRLLGEHFGITARRCNGDELLALEPALKSGLAGGWYYEHDAHLRPDRLCASWRTLLAERGVDFREHCPLREIIGHNGRALTVRTGQGEFDGEMFVVACGAWTPLLAEQLGCRLPIQPGKGYSLTMPRPQICPTIPMLLPEDRVAVTPMATGYRLGSILEFAGYDTRLPPRRMDYLRSTAGRYLREPWAEPVQEQWFGWRPMTPDSLPVIDHAPLWSNVLIAAGHNTVGLTLAPATGKLVAELARDLAPHVPPEPFSIRRFSVK